MLFDTFLLLFEGDATGAKKGAEEAGKATDDLGQKVKHTDELTTGLGNNFLSLAKTAGAAIAALISVSALTQAIFQAADYADQANEVAEITGQNIQLIDTYSNAVKLFGGSAEAFRGTLSNLSGSLAQMDATGKSRVAPFFKELGISITDVKGKTKDAIPLLLEVADAFEGMSKQESLGFGKKLGLDQGTILFLQQGRREVENVLRKQKELGAVTEEQGRIADAYNDELDNTGHAFRSIALAISEVVLPPITEFLKIITDILVALRNSDVLTAFGDDVKIIVNAFVSATEWVRKFIDESVGMQKFLDVLSSAFFTAINPMRVFSQLLDDILHFLAGMPSAIGEVVKSLNPLTNFFDGYDGITGDLIMKGRNALGLAGSSPIGATSSNSISNSRNTSSSRTVTIGEINVQTQATDANAMAGDMTGALQRQMNQTLNDFDDGTRI